jgi:hypothetical protein
MQHRVVHFIRRKERQTVRAVEKRCLVVEIERKSAGVFGLFSNTEIVAKGALSLEPLLSSSLLQTVVPLHPGNAPITADGFEGSRKTSEIAPGYEGPCGGLSVSLRLNTPVRDPSVRMVEFKKPVVTSWPPLSAAAVVPAAPPPATMQLQSAAAAAAAAAPLPSFTGPAAAGAAAPVATAAAAGGTSTTLSSSPAPAPAPAPAAAVAAPSLPAFNYAAKFPLLAAAKIDVYGPNFVPDDVAFLVGNTHVAGPELDRCNTRILELQGGLKKAEVALKTLQGKQAAGPPPSVQGEDAIESWNSSLLEGTTKAQMTIDNIQRELVSLATRADTLSKAINSLIADIQAGKATPADYATSLESYAARDMEMARAVMECASSVMTPSEFTAATGTPLPSWCVCLASHPGTVQKIPLKFEPQVAKNLIVERIKSLLNEKKMVLGEGEGGGGT